MPLRIAACLSLFAAACGSGAEDRLPLHEAAAPLPAPTLAPRGSISVGGGQACTIAAGRVACWSIFDEPARPMWIEGLDGMTGVGAGAEGGCAWNARGAVWCWDTSGGAQAVATRVAGVDDAMQVVVDFGLACALRRGGRVACWTTDNAGGCRTAPRSGRLRRTIDPPEGVACGLHEVPSLEGAVELAIAGWHACARIAAGVSCWLGTRGSPAALARSAGAISLAGVGRPRLYSSTGFATDDSFFALVGGHVLGWALAGATARPRNDIDAAGADAVRIAAGTNQICVLGHGVTCWIDGGARREHALTAVDLGASVAACARTTADRVACWSAREEPMLLPKLTAAPH